ncbi:MAG: hypothetical protein GC153_07415 [Alphaproteobacteria bacterium]|nr:hypothetical protein [Alphaproteobacteria bacterium]
MAQLVLTAASAVGSTLGRVGVGAILARTVAGTAAAYAAGVAERLIFGPQHRKVTGPRLDALAVQASTEGAGVARVYGRARLAGQVIWAANFRETVSETTESAGKGSRLSPKTTVTEYLYSVSFAVGLCEGVIDRVARVWADGKPFDMSSATCRVYRGDETQMPDAAIEAVEGAGGAPAFRGLAYVVFEDLPLKDFGNRIPQFSFEVEKGLRQEDPAALENAVAAVCMIPGSGEFALGTTAATRDAGEGVTVSENVHNNDGVTDFVASLDALESALPNVSSVSLAVSWFGSDLRAGACAIRPGVETAAKTTAPYDWRVGPTTRALAHVVSLHEGAPAYGGTPCDRSVREAIAALKARGLEVMFHPFILMDIPSGNGLPDPYGGAEQGAYPWRGRITVGANDKTAAAADDIAAFFGSAAPGDFSVVGGEIAYAGPDEWSFRRMILHYAHLCAQAGGVDRFLIGSELRGITTARSDASTYPAAAALAALASDVKTILPGAKISYGADWSEYFGHQPGDGSGDVYFHLDEFWADPAVDFVGVDNYAPLADWRDGFAHLDAEAGYAGPHERAYLQANIEGGEDYDWYYASGADRDAQTRSPITDGAYGEPWIYRAKDFRNWWARAHYNRPGGARAAAPTAWVPESKPIVFAETGCAAIDKGANAPNRFLDPKSSESAAPPYSSGARDDLAQRRALEAVHAYWRDPANNPVSSVYGGPMIDAERIHVWCWDARPFPFFPALSDVWGDAGNWERGHWLNGRAGRAPLDLLVAALAGAAGAVETTGLKAMLTGYLIDRPMSPREAIDPLASIFQFDMVETGEGLRFQTRDGAPALTLGAGDLVARETGAISVSLADSADLPAAFRLGFVDEQSDYAPAVAEARDPGAFVLREASVEAPLVLTEAEAAARARSILADAHLMRETATFSLPPSRLAAEPGDVLYVDADGAPRRWRVTQIVDGAERKVEAARVSPSVYEAPLGASAFKPPALVARYGAPLFAALDAPLIGEMTDGAALFAAFADPWPGAVSLYRPGASGPVLAASARGRAVIGRLDGALAPGVSGRWLGQSLRVKLNFGGLASASEAEVLAGANALLVMTAAGPELAQFRDAALGTDGVWTLSPLLRGQAGTEDRAALGAAAGAACVLVNAALVEAPYPADLRGTALDWQAGPSADYPDTASFAHQTLTMTARSALPLSPVRLGVRAEAGGLRLFWIRRTRKGGDNWESEVPLGEAQERYRVRVYDGATLLRSIDVAPPFEGDPYGRPNVLYTNEDIAADFGAGGLAGASDPAFEVAQISDLVGPGLAARSALA